MFHLGWRPGILSKMLSRQGRRRQFAHILLCESLSTIHAEFACASSIRLGPSALVLIDEDGSIWESPTVDLADSGMIARGPILELGSRTL